MIVPDPDRLEARNAAFDVDYVVCQRCGGKVMVEVATDGNGRLVETLRPCESCKVLERRMTTDETYRRAAGLMRANPFWTNRRVYAEMLRYGTPSMSAESFVNDIAYSIRKRFRIRGS